MKFFEGLEQVYRTHHQDKERYGNTVFVDERSKLLQAHVGTGKNVLDIGCRDGTLTKTYAAGNTVTGLDIDTTALKYAEELLNITTKQTDLNGEWGVASESYDVVVAGEVLEHIYFPSTVTRKVRDALTPGGVFLGSVPNAFNAKNRARLLLGRKEHTPLADPTHINHFTHHELINILEEYFNDVSIIPIGNYARWDKYWPGMFSFDLFFVARNKK